MCGLEERKGKSLRNSASLLYKYKWQLSLLHCTGRRPKHLHTDLPGIISGREHWLNSGTIWGKPHVSECPWLDKQFTQVATPSLLICIEQQTWISGSWMQNHIYLDTKLLEIKIPLAHFFRVAWLTEPKQNPMYGNGPIQRAEPKILTTYWCLYFL